MMKMSGGDADVVKIEANAGVVQTDIKGPAILTTAELAIAAVGCADSIAETKMISVEDAADLVISAIQEHLIMIKEGEDDTD